MRLLFSTLNSFEIHTESLHHEQILPMRNRALANAKCVLYTHVFQQFTLTQQRANCLGIPGQLLGANETVYPQQSPLAK